MCDDTKKVVRLGSIVVSGDYVAGSLAAIKEANDNNEVYNHTIELFYVLMTDRFYNPYTDEILNTSLISVLQKNVAAIIRTDWYVTLRLRGFLNYFHKPLLPVIDPLSLSGQDYTSAMKNIIHFRVNVQTEMAHLMRYAVMRYGCAHAGFIHAPLADAKGIAIAAKEVYNKLGLHSEVWEFNHVSYKTPELLKFVFEDDPLRRCIFILSNFQTVGKVLTDMVRDSRYRPDEYAVFIPSAGSGEMYKVDGSAEKLKHVYISRHVPNPGHHHEKAVARYTDALSAWLKNPVGWDPAKGNGTYGNVPNVNGLEGYMSTRYTIELLKRAVTDPRGINTVVNGTSAMLDYAYSTRTSVGDFPLFSLIDQCSTKPFVGACFCNVLSRVIYLNEVNTTTGLQQPISDDPLLPQVDVTISPMQDCGSTLQDVRLPTNVYLLRPYTLSTPEEGAYQLVRLTAYAYFKYLNGNTQILSADSPKVFVLVEAILPPDGSQEALDKITATRTPFVALGSMIDDKGATPTKPNGIAMLYSFLTTKRVQEPTLRSFEDGWDPTLFDFDTSFADLAYGLFSYYEDHKSMYSGIHAIVTPEKRFSDLMRKLLDTFQHRIDPFTSDDADEVTKHISSLEGDSPFIIMIPTQTSVLVMNAALAACVKRAESAKCTLGLVTYEFTISGILDLYAPFSNENISSPFPDSFDLLFSSSLTAWWSEGSALHSAMKALPTYKNKNFLPLNPIPFFSLVGAIVTTTLSNAATGESAAMTLYRSGTLSALDMSYGPFTNHTCSKEVIEENTPERDCQCTKGVRRIRVHSAHDWLNRDTSSRTQKYSAYLRTCGVMFRPLEPLPKDNTWKIILGAVVGGVALLAIIGLILFCFCCYMGRNNWNAPKDDTQPFAIVFTDIQSSTALWARAPTVMSNGVDQHHALIRKLIVKFKGYEVKTIGDSFMVAFSDPEAATSFGLAVQETLYDAEWPDEIDAAYRELLMEADEARVVAQAQANHNICSASCVSGVDSPNGSMSAPFQTHPQHSGADFSAGDVRELQKSVLSGVLDKAPYSAWNLPAGPDYDAVWHGLRVRVGIHYGYGEIKKDPTSKGYDYYGTVVNTAARVEGVGHGGQLLVTQDTYEALGNKFSPANGIMSLNLGRQPLRGLDVDTVLYQLLPQRLAGRNFPPLRLDVENAIEKDDDDSTTTYSQHSRSTETIIEGPEQFASRLLKRSQGSTLTCRQPVTVTELLTCYRFIHGMIATSDTKWRHDTIKHIAKAWRVPFRPLKPVKGTTKGNKGLDVLMPPVMSISLRVLRYVANKYGRGMLTSPHMNPLHNSTNTSMKNTSTILSPMHHPRDYTTTASNHNYNNNNNNTFTPVNLASNSCGNILTSLTGGATNGNLNVNMNMLTNSNSNNLNVINSYNNTVSSVHNNNNNTTNSNNNNNNNNNTNNSNNNNTNNSGDNMKTLFPIETQEDKRAQQAMMPGAASVTAQ